MARGRNLVRHPRTLRERAIATAKWLALYELLQAAEDETYEISFRFVVFVWLIRYFQTARYLNLRSSLSFYKSTAHRDMVLSVGSDRIFKNAFRMTMVQFNFVVDAIKDHPQFQNRGRKPQASVAIQLKVALQRLAHDGSLAGYESIGPSMGVSVGTAHEYYQRCVLALRDNVEQFITWPHADRKTQVKAHFARKGFPDAVGIVDGTMFPFVRAPTWNRDLWATRKKNFAMGATGVCDHHVIFIAFTTGYYGSWHDSTAYRTTPPYQRKNQHFSDQEHLLGDAAYKSSPTMMTGYHRMQRPIINAHRFNKRLNSARARIEHAFGMLKGRFPSLTNLRQVIRQEEDVDKVCNHVMACVVVHNILTMLDKDDEELMDLDAQRNLEELRQEQERPDVQVNGAVEEEIPAPGEEVDEEIDFEDWREVARYDAAMKTWGDIKRAQRKAIMFSE